MDPWTPRLFLASSLSQMDNNLNVDVEHFCAPVVHPITGETITSYKKLANNPATKEIWQTGFGKEWGHMAQGNNKTKEEGTNSIFVMSHKQIEKVTKEGRTFTYARLVIDFRPQKKRSQPRPIDRGWDPFPVGGSQ